MTSKLQILRTQLQSLLQRRLWVRRALAAAAIVLAIAWGLLAVFALDVLFDLDVWQRTVVMLLAVVGIGWGIRRYAFPWLGSREDEIDLAIAVERQHGITSDLVGALQFEMREGASSVAAIAVERESSQLAHAVIDYVAALGRDLNVYAGHDYPPWRTRAALLAGTLGAIVVLAVVFPAYLQSFASRLFLSDTSYPTRTQIERVAVNGQAVDFSERRPTVRVPRGQALQFEVIAGGELPAEGRVSFHGANSAPAPIPLVVREAASDETQAETHESDANAAHVKRDFAGRLPRALEPMQFEIQLGDATSRPVAIEVVPLPFVELSVTATPPEYIRAVSEMPPATAGQLQLAVPEGSAIAFAIPSSSKPLAEVSLKLIAGSAAGEADESGDEIVKFTAVDANRRQWKMVAVPERFKALIEPIRFELHVLDDEGLALETPLRGAVRIQPDRAPRIAVATIHKRVLPQAAPTLELVADDDYALGDVTARVQVEREGSIMGTHNVVVRTGEPITGALLPWRRTFRLPLADWSLRVGDRLAVTLSATDYRGDLPGQTGESTPLTMEVTDEAGLLATIAEGDEQSEQRINAILQRQLGSGE